MKRVNIISKIVARGGGTVVSPSKNDAPVDLSDYILKEVWDKCWEVRRTDDGDEYLFGKLPIALQFDLASFVDEGLIDLPTLYDGLPIDNQTIYWEEVTDENGKKSRVLKVAEMGDDEYSWDEITGKPSWIGSSKPSYSWDEITGRPDLSDMATETWVGNNFLSLEGGTLSGDLRLEGSSVYGTTLYFGDGSYCYISEPSDDMMKVYASKGIVLQTGSSYYVEVSSKGLKVNGGILEYNGEYWVLNGDLLVNGGITSNE